MKKLPFKVLVLDNKINETESHFYYFIIALIDDIVGTIYD